MHVNKGAVKKLPTIAANTNDFTPTPPDLTINKAIKDAKICTIIDICNLFNSTLVSTCPKSVPLNKP